MAGVSEIFEEAATQSRDPRDGQLERRLAAILIADVAGYSRLVGADEAGTLAQWKDHWRALIDPKLAEHKGRVVRIAGDGLLVEFASVVAAVRCAVEFQRAMRERNAAVPSERRIEFRVGINVGDIIIHGEDIWGDGVVLAARLEALAEPGGICVSRRVQVDVEGKIDVVFDDMGERQLKNIERRVKVFHVRELAAHAALAGEPRLGRAPRPNMAARVAALWRGRFAGRAATRGRTAAGAGLMTVGVCAAALWWGGVRDAHDPASPTSEAALSSTTKAAPIALSIVVLPFVNVGGDPKQDYFADGITDSLTTDLSHALPGSFVVSRDTAFTYKGRAADVRRIGRELAVSYALAGSILPDRDRVRVNSELIDAQSGIQLWAERFDIERGDILQVQDVIVGRLARAIGLKVIDAEARRSETERPRSAEAADLVMRARAIVNRPTSAANMMAARELYEQALRVEADNADALAGIATSFVFEVLNGYYARGNEERLQQAQALVARTLAVAPRHLASLKAKAAVLRARGRFEDAIVAAETIIAENPGEPWAYKEIGLSRMYLGRTKEALEWFAKAEQIGPRDPGRWTWLDGRGQALILLGRDAEAIQSLRLALDANPNSVFTHALLAAAYALEGRIGDARVALARYSEVRPGETVANFRKYTPVPLALTSADYQRQRQRLTDGLRTAGMPERAAPIGDAIPTEP